MVKSWIISRGILTIIAINIICVIGLLLLPLYYQKILALFQIVIDIIMIFIMKAMMWYAKKKVGPLY